MHRIAVAADFAVACEVDDFLWPWDTSTPVVMVHGFARNAACWRRWVPIVATNRRVYRPELRGFGGSDVPDDGFAFDADVILGDLLAVLDACRVGSAHFVGDSSGGLFCLLFAQAHPERVASLVLCDTPAKGTESTTPTIREIYALGEESSDAAILKYGVEAWCRQTLSYRLDLDRAPVALQEWYVREIAKTPPHVAAALNRYLHPRGAPSPVSGLRLTEIRMPVLLLGGDKSKLSGDQQEMLRRLLPDARLHVFKGYGHGVAILAAEACAAKAAEFWNAQVG